jgi:hypothetical protein
MTLSLGRFVGSTYDWIRAAAFELSPAGRAGAKERDRADAFLDAFARAGDARFSGTVLVDGTFDNPNYWARYALLRRSLGLAQAREVGIVGPFKRRHVRGTFERMGISEICDFGEMAPDAQTRDAAQKLAAQTRDPDGALAWQLPGGMNPAILYDGVLKAQRLPSVDLLRADFVPNVAQALACFARAREILAATKPDLLVVSHPVGLRCAGLAWHALQQGIPTILAFGLFGVLRYARMDKPDDLFEFYDHPTQAEIDGLPEEKALLLQAIGRRYVDARMRGKSDDLAALLAFRRRPGFVDRAAIAARFGWDPAKPIVAVYASNWFDWPHQLGMRNFRDFRDWIAVTAAAAAANRDVNWLFKPHPAETVFGGPSLTELLPQMATGPNIALCPTDWNNGAVMKAIDALVTYHGTSGVEFAALGKPVLLPDVGKYHRAGFAHVAQSRADYVDCLSRRWWTSRDAVGDRRRAEIYAGWWFCAADWQGGFVFEDDSRRDALYAGLPALFADNPGAVAREVDEIAAWWRSGETHYHKTKMRRAEGYALSNVSN